MHGRHGKKNSKRVKLGKKYKVEKKVGEHHRKLKRDIKRHPEKHAKRISDPGVPNSCPFKTQLLHEAQRARCNEQERGEKIQKELKMRRKNDKEAMFCKNRNIGEFMTDAEKRGKEFKTISGLGENQEKFTDKSAKTFYKEFKKVVEASDVILEVLDARDPQGCRCFPMEDLVKANPNKRLVLILNKADLVPRTNLEAWLSYLRKFYPVVLFKASTQNQSKNISRLSSRSAQNEKSFTTSRCVGADLLLQLLKNYSRSENIKTAIVVGVVGMPNVGKSSLINSLKRSKACNVGATPGVTKTLQEVCLDSKVRLLDCPGVILPGRNSNDSGSSLRNAFKLEDLDDPISPVEVIMKRAGKEKLMIRYGMPAFENTAEFLALYAKRTGKLAKGGLPKIEDAARSILHDWNIGDLNYYTLPPQEESTGEENLPKIVSKLSKEFQISDFELAEEELLESLPEVKQALTMCLEGLNPIMTEFELADVDEVMEETGDIELKIPDKDLVSEVIVDLPNKEVTVAEVISERKERWETEIKEIDFSTAPLKKLQKKVSKKLRKEKKRNERKAADLADALEAFQGIGS